MVRSNPKSFSQPDVLKTIQPGCLLRILESCRSLLEEGGFAWPDSADAEVDYLRLGGLLAQPDERMDSHVIDGLHVIGTLGADENFDELLDIARRNFIEVDLDATAADLAARIWVEAPDMLVLKERELGSQRRRKFESFRARDPLNVIPPGDLPCSIEGLEAALEAWFIAKKRGVGCLVVRKDLAGEVRFLVQHGELCRREPSRKGPQSTCTFFRPEKTDLVVYDFISNELRINARSLGELKLYREQFGRHMFGDPEWFVYAQKYTLEPLRADGQRSLECRDIWGIDRVWLTELEYGWPDQALHLIEKKKADDLFAALAHRKASLPEDARLLKARFAVKLTGEASPRPLMIQPPNIADYGRGEEAAPIEQFLRERRFVQVGTEADDETTQPFMAVA
jgi:hypothetical protein